MPIETGAYCQYCAQNGKLIPFDEAFERMVQWSQKENPDTPRKEVEAQTLQFMSQRPAWKDHPSVASGLGK